MLPQFKINIHYTKCQIMYKSILKNKGILNISEYHGPNWPAYVWPADDIHVCSIFPYFSKFTYTWFGTKITLLHLQVQCLCYNESGCNQHNEAKVEALIKATNNDPVLAEVNKSIRQLRADLKRTIQRYSRQMNPEGEEEDEGAILAEEWLKKNSNTILTAIIQKTVQWWNENYFFNFLLVLIYY